MWIWPSCRRPVFRRHGSSPLPLPRIPSPPATMRMGFASLRRTLPCHRSPLQCPAEPSHLRASRCSLPCAMLLSVLRPGRRPLCAAVTGRCSGESPFHWPEPPLPSLAVEEAVVVANEREDFQSSASHLVDEDEDNCGEDFEEEEYYEDYVD